MSRRQAVLVAATLFMTAASHALAVDRWCSGYPGSIFCDDYDRDCIVEQQPPEPQVCADGATRGDPQLRGVWQLTSFVVNTQQQCGNNMVVEDVALGVLPTRPFGGRCPNEGDEAGELAQNTVDLTPYVQTRMLGSTLVNGTDSQPLVLTFTMGALALGAMQYNNGYMELGLNDPDRWNSITNPFKAVTDWIPVGASDGAGCVDCALSCPEGQTASHNRWPSICQQEFPHPSCPPKMTIVRNTLAVGALALLDNNPCHCCPSPTPGKAGYASRCPAEWRTPDFPDGWQEPTNWHLSYFDGVEWRILREGMGGPGSYGDFRYGNYWIRTVKPDGTTVGNTDSAWETVELTIKTSTVDIYHKTKMVDLVDGQWVERYVESKAYDLPRHYSGAFNRLRAGTDEGCQLIKQGGTGYQGTYQCDSLAIESYRMRRCKINKEDCCSNCGTQVLARYRSSYVTFDNVKLAGGIGDVEIGACCLNNANCVETDTYTCETIMGGRYQGPGVSCLAAACCPYPFADRDGDGDVDQTDFGAWQACYTGPVAASVPTGCECFNRDGDTDVDSEDFTAFNNCLTGANVKWTAGGLCTP